MIFRRSLAIMLLFSCIQPAARPQPSAGANPKRAENLAKAAMERATFAEQHPLYLDENLHEEVTVGAHPKLIGVINRLSAATGLRFTLSAELVHHDPDFGDLGELGEIPAYSLMEIIAECDLDDGCWEKVEGGYRLTGTSRTPLPPRRFRWWWAALPAAMVLAATFVVYRRRGQIGPE